VRTNPTTLFDEDGFGDVISDIRSLRLQIAGSTNDLNAGAVAADQDTAEEDLTPLTLADVQALIDDAIGGDSSSTATACSSYRLSSSQQAFPATTSATIVFNTTEYDPLSMQNTSTGVMTISEAGTYEVEAIVYVAPTGGATDLSTGAILSFSTAISHDGYLSGDSGAAIALQGAIPIRTTQRLVAGETILVSFTNYSIGNACSVFGTLSATRIGD
jgi:hypothetical protein